MGLRLLRDLLSALRAMGLLWGSFLRSILLFVHAAKYSLPQQGSYFRPWTGGILPIRGIAVLKRIKNSVALRRVTDEYSSGSDPWLTAHFDSSSMLLNKREN